MRPCSFTITQFFQVLKSYNLQFFRNYRFTITQFFQVLKYRHSSWKIWISFTITQFFQVLKFWYILGKQYSSFTITQFFQVLKSILLPSLTTIGFTITQFFQVLKCQINHLIWNFSLLNPLLLYYSTVSFNRKAFSTLFIPVLTAIFMHKLSCSSFKNTFSCKCNLIFSFPILWTIPCIPLLILASSHTTCLG